MIPIINIVGCSNSGKSTLFNKLTNSKNILISNYYNLTKERSYGTGFLGNYSYLLIDNPGFFFENKDFYNIIINLDLSLEESDIIIFLIDIDKGISNDDLIISKILKKKKKYVFLIFNKIDLKKNLYFDFFNINKLGLGKPYFISLIKNFNIKFLINKILNIFCYNKICIKKKISKKIKISVIGKPNIGKSTLINSLLNKNKLVTFNKINTTVNLNFINFKYKKYKFFFIDTFGLNFKKNIFKNIKNISFIKTLQVIILSNIIIFLISFDQNFYNIDIDIFNFSKKEFMPLLILINKSDLFNIIYKIFFKIYLKKKINILKFFYIFFISSLKKKNLNYIKIYIEKIYLISIIKLSTNKLNFIFNKINIFFKKKYKFKKIKLNYVHQGGKNPPLIIIYSNKKNFLNKYYKFFFIKLILKKFFLKSIFIKIKFK